MTASSRKTAIRVVLATVATAFGLAFFAGPASAEDTVWLCKPGQADNPCLGKMDGISTSPGFVDTELGYEAAENPPVDCFYLYPTQSNQATLNSNLDKDPEIRNVAINQARQFSRICDVYAPMYRQYTLDSLGGPISDEVRDTAYNSVLGAWKDYLENHNEGRGVVIIGHSQGTSHMARLIAEEVDGKPNVRKRIISAILPGANVYVPKGRLVGGQFQNIPACETGDQVGCVIAYSMFTGQPAIDSRFGRVGTGYWVNPAPRPDKASFDVLCTNPADLAGDNGILRPLANLPAFLGQAEPAKPWQAMPDFYRGECRTVEEAGGGTVSWLNIEDIREPGDTRSDLSALIVRDGDLHLGDINLALDSLVSVAASQSRAYVSTERARVVKERNGVRKQLKSAKKKAKKLSKTARKAARKCKKLDRGCGKAKRLDKKSKKAGRKVSSLKKRDQALTGEIKSLVGPEA
jgi:hypothetical protein